MAAWEEFKYIPEWEGPLSGRSFEKQTEDAINRVAQFVDSRIEERIEDELASAAVIRPYDGLPASAGTPFSGQSLDYARGDHVHPAQSACMFASSAAYVGRLASPFSIVLSGAASGAAATDGSGDAVINVVIPAATAESAGLMTPEDKAAIGGVSALPRFVSVSAATIPDPVSGGNSSAAVSPSGAALVLNAGRGALAAMETVDGGAVQLVNMYVGADFEVLANETDPGFMAPADKLALGSAFSDASVEGGLLTLSANNGTSMALPVGGGGGGGTAGGSALVSVSGAFSFKTPRLAQNRQTLLVYGVSGASSVQIASGSPLLRSLDQYSKPFTASAYEAAESFSMNCLVDLGDPDILYAGLPGSAAVSAINASPDGVVTPNALLTVTHSSDELVGPHGEVWTMEDAALYYAAGQKPEWWADGSPTPPAPEATDDYGTFAVAWTGDGSGEYGLSITWTPRWEYLTKTQPQGVSVDGRIGSAGTPSTIVSIASTAAGAPVLQDGIPYDIGWFDTSAFQASGGSVDPDTGEPWPDPEPPALPVDRATLGFVLSVNAPFVESGMAAATVSCSIRAQELTAEMPYSAAQNLPISVVWAEPDDEHVNGPTSAYGTVTVGWQRSEDLYEDDPNDPSAPPILVSAARPYTYSASVVWTPAEGAVPPDEGALTLTENAADETQRVEDVDFSAIAGPVMDLQSSVSALASTGALLGSAAIVSAGLSLEAGRTEKLSTEPFALGCSLFGAGAAAVSKYANAQAAYVVSGMSPQGGAVSWGGSQFFYPSYADAEAAVSGALSGGSVVMPRNRGAVLNVPDGAAGPVVLYAKMDSAAAVGTRDPDTGEWSGGWSSIDDMTAGGSFCSASIPAASLPPFSSGASSVVFEMDGANHDGTTFTVAVTRQNPDDDPDGAKSYYVAAQWWYPEDYAASGGSWNGYEPYANVALRTLTAAGEPGPGNTVNIAKAVKYLADNAQEIPGW